jgi:uncharacterized protein YecE (DUF72 family)
MIRVGTAGYGYHDWSPSFYPPNLVHEEYLSYYSERFDCCELNSTFFRWPREEDFAGLLARSREALIFTVKAHRRLTHQREGDLSSARRFAETLSPLVEAERLGVVMAQFPFSFVNNPAHRAYVCRLRAALDLPLVVEFRNDNWFNEATLDFLRGWGIGFVCVDAPEEAGMPGPRAIATSDIGYVRFHGRNATQWWNKDGASRYDYKYRRLEILAWVPRLKEIDRQAKMTFVVFNNHWRGQAVANAQALRKIVNKKRVKPTTAHAVAVGAV